MIALTVLSGSRSAVNVYLSTASVVSGSRADVGSRIRGSRNRNFDVEAIESAKKGSRPRQKKIASDPMMMEGTKLGERDKENER